MKTKFKKILLSTTLGLTLVSLTGCDFLKNKDNNNDNYDEVIKNDNKNTDDLNNDKKDETKNDNQGEKLDTNDNTIDGGISKQENLKSKAIVDCNAQFRVSQFQMDVNKEEGVARIYNVNFDKENNLEVTVAKVIRKENEYIEPQDVAAYVQAFNTWPSNYMLSGNSDKEKRESKKRVVETIGINGRLAFEWSRNKNRSKSYCYNMGPWLNEDGWETYYELDISTPKMNPSYNDGYRVNNRGTFRLVWFPGTSQARYVDKVHGNESVIVFTDDHYIHFHEYYNYFNGWSSRFNGELKRPDNSRPNVQTIDIKIKK